MLDKIKKALSITWQFILLAVLAIASILIIRKIREVKVTSKIPPARIDKDGNPIPIGTPDEHGFTQWTEKEFQVPSSGANTLVIDGQEVKLPVGVTAGNVSKVVQVKDNTYVTEVKDTTGVDATSLINLLQGK